MRKYLKAALILSGAVILTGCNWSGSGTLTDTGELAAIASIAMDYNSQQATAALGQMDVEDLEEDGAKTLFVEEAEKVLQDGTIVTITKTHDDNDTPETTEDDLLTVSRVFDMWLGEEKTEIIERPLRPAADWSLWVDDSLVQNGSCEEYIGGIKIAYGTIKATWLRTGDEVRLTKIDKEYIRLDRNGIIVRTIIEIDENGLESKSKLRIRVTDGNEVIIHSFTFEEIDEDGVIFTKIISSDGRYSIIRNQKDPRITEFYTAEGILVKRSTEARDSENRALNITVEFFDSEGIKTYEKNIAVKFRFIGDEVIITKTFDDKREVIISISESDEGYTVTKNGHVYSIVFTESGIEIYDNIGDLLAYITVNDDGSWTVETPEGVDTVAAL